MEDEPHVLLYIHWDGTQGRPFPDVSGVFPSWQAANAARSGKMSPQSYHVKKLPNVQIITTTQGVKYEVR